MKTDVLLLQAYIFLSPFYFFRSGIPQISDYIMILAIVFIFVQYGFKIPASVLKDTGYWGLFVLWALTVNLIWILQHNEASVLYHPVFYIYNYLVYLSIKIIACKNSTIKKNIYYSVGYTLLIQAMLAVFLVDLTGFRQTVFFNNPNQLGYFALISLTIFLAGSRAEDIKPQFSVAVQLSGVFLVAISLSSAAMLATFMLLFYHYIRYMQKYWKVLAVSVCIGAIVWSSPLRPQILDHIINNVGLRLSAIGLSDDDNLVGRGYDRIINHPEYLVFGAGEGANARFQSRLQDELHSTWGALLFSYGIIGLLLFGFGLLHIMLKATLTSFFYLVPVFFYGLTHQGLRFTHFWLLLVFMDISGRQIQGYAGKPLKAGGSLRLYGRCSLKL